MDCSQILPGAVSPGQCTVATGYYSDHPFIVYASGKDVVILDGTLRHLQTILGSSRGYSDVNVSCVSCSETSGRIAAVWGSDVVFLQPVPKDDLVADSGTRVSSDFPGQWAVSHTEVLNYPARSLSWNRDGTQLLVGGIYITLWSYEQEVSKANLLVPETNGSEGVTGVSGVQWKEVWRCEMAHQIIHLEFSPDGSYFASAGEKDRLVKIWYRSFPYAGGLGSSMMFSFAYIAHPHMVTGFVWRHTSAHMPRGFVPNVLLTYCKDNICRLWSHTIHSTSEYRYTMRFFIAASIDPISDIPFRTSLPITDDLPFSVHWLNNKSTAFSNKAEKFHAGALLPMSRLGSVLSFASSINEEMLQSWVCIDDREQQSQSNATSSASGQSSPHNGDPLQKPQTYSLSNFLSANRPSVGGAPKPTAQDSRTSEHKRALAHLMEDWNLSPDLLLCIHPSAGSLMVWTVEGLDAPPNTSRLVHVSFSSCLPHIFPPHLSQSLRQNLLQFIIKEPEAVQTREATAEGETVSNMSLPVPSIRLPGTGNRGTDGLKDVPKQKPESTLYLISSHMNGSLNTWSVELTPQSNYSTSIAGLIHCGGTGGHHCKVNSIQRHPWLPVVMTVSSQVRDGNKEEEEEKNGGISNVVASELIIWNADLPGPLQHKSRLNELSRMLSTDPTAFQLVTWVPPISVGGGTEGAFARHPSSGVFIANIGKELCLFQTSLYCTTKSSSGITPLSTMDKGKSLDADTGAAGGHSMTVTSQLGKEGVLQIGKIIEDISRYEKIVGLHSFRLCSLVTSLDIKKSVGSKFHRDVVVVLLENKAQDLLKSDTPISRGMKTFVHMWRLTFSQKTAKVSKKEGESTTPTVSPYQASIVKVYSGELPLLNGSHVIHSSPACDVASSLQLQLPTLSSPFLFTTVSSDGSVQCWQFSRKPKEVSSPPPDDTLSEEDDESLEFELYEVFGLPSSQTGNAAAFSKCLDCGEDETIKALPTASLLPSAISSAYPGRFALAHRLTRAPTPDHHPTSRASIVRSTLDQHAAVTVWECESSGGLKWNCEATLLLSGVTGVLTANSNDSNDSVMMDWVPMENGAYLLATCFASTTSVFGMRLPRGEEEFMTANRQKGFQSLANTLTKTGTRASWQCLVQFPCSPPGLGLTIKCFAYTGSNSLVLSVGSEMHLYSCWVREDRLFPLLDKHHSSNVSKQVSQLFHEPAPYGDEVDEARLVNLLDYAHAVNTPLPQYHPKILIELMNSGKIKSVKAILVNLVKYLLLYSPKMKPKGNYFDEGGFEGMYEKEETGKRKRLLSVSSDGILRRSKLVDSKTTVERVPHLSLAKMGILSAQNEDAPEAVEEKVAETAEAVEEEEYDQLFTRTNTLTDMDALNYEFEEQTEDDILFSELEPGKDNFTPDLAKKLTSILRYAQLLDLSDLEQVRLLAIAETVANTKMSFGEHTQAPDSSAYPALDLSSTAGGGYASSGLTHGVRGREAMDDCGLRYLLALQNYITLSESLPSNVTADKLPPSDYIWAFHSDAENELLAAVPCVEKDRLSWMELREVGVGWWLRSSDKLRLLIERLAKAQFMEKQDPLNAILFYIAMKKVSLVKGLFRTIGDQRMSTFFSNDFQIPRWRKAALKNAFALLGKQRFEQAAAFFLLGGKLWDAVEVCVDRLGDRQLALVIIRLNEGDQGPIYQRFLSEFILGVPIDQTLPVPSHMEPHPDPFLRSIAHWLLQDYSNALDTLLLSQQASRADKNRAKQEVFNPAVFNFYFFLRTSPLLIRRDLGNPATSVFHKNQLLVPTLKNPASSGLSNVGEEPFTPAERNLLFSTAYYHLCHGCPLLALNVLSKLPKSCGLGAEVCHACTSSDTGSKTSLNVGVSSGGDAPPLGNKGGKSLAVMIESGTIDDFGLGGTKSNQGGMIEDEDDWSKPVMSNRFKDEEDDIDWSKPFTSNQLQDEEEEFDWSKPISSGDLGNDDDLSPPNFELSTEQSQGEDEPDVLFLDHMEEMKHNLSSSTLSTRGLFILSLAEQLQYNACLSILTEELITIYVPACCQYLWKSKGKDFLPLLPLPKAGKDSRQTLASHYEANVFEKTILDLRALLVAWLREETNLVKEICGFEQTVANSSSDNRSSTSAPAGYDLLTTLMNYVSLHAATSPSLHTIHVELMHLMNTLLPWSVGVPPSLTQDTEPALPNCAVDPSQLPILTSSSLPARHLTNLTLHLRLMSARVVTILSEHTYPPIATQALPHLDKVFELCCALSSCMIICLSPTRFTDFSGPTVTTGLTMNSDLTPSPSGILTDSGQYQQSGGSPYLSAGRGADLTRPNTKPSKWPGVTEWPSMLSSDEGKDPTPLSLVLVECLVSVYLGLFSVAWSQHSITDLLLLLKNGPSGEMWYSVFGGGIDIKRDEKTQRGLSRKGLLQSMENMAQKFKMLRRSSSTESPVEFAPRLFVPPQRTLLDYYLTVPKVEKHRLDSSMAMEEGYFVCGLEEEEAETDTEDLEDSGERVPVGKGGPLFRIGPVLSESDGGTEDAHNNPNSFAWCLMNLAISKLLMSSVKKVLLTAGVDTIELITASPLLYSTLKLLEEWESIFTKRLDSLGQVPDDFFTQDDEDEDVVSFQVGPALTRHKSILEPDHSPFSGKSKQSKQAEHLWQFLVHKEEVLETFIHYLFKSKQQKTQSPTRSLGSLSEEDECQSGTLEKSLDRLPVLSSECRVVYKENDSTVTSFCVNSLNNTVLALALSREVIEIEVPDTSELDNLPEADSGAPIGAPPSRSFSMPFRKEDFVMVQTTSTAPGKMKRPQSSIFNAARLSLAPFSNTSSSNLTHSQTGQNSSLGSPVISHIQLTKRSVFGVRRMTPHPTLAYYLTGSMDGSVVLWEFGNPNPISTQRQPGTGASVTMMRFTPQGNKFGVTDNSGRLFLWQGIHTAAHKPYRTLASGMRHLSDFLFLGSSSFIATCGDGPDNRNVYLWDTLLPSKISVVKEFVCREAGVTSLGYSCSKQQLFCGDRRGEVLIFDLKQMTLLQSLLVHNSTVNRIVVDDINGFIATGSADGDIKVLDSSSFEELTSYPGVHAKSRLFRQTEGGVTDLRILPGGRLYSCGADGSVKCQTIVL